MISIPDVLSAHVNALALKAAVAAYYGADYPVPVRRRCPCTELVDAAKMHNYMAYDSE